MFDDMKFASINEKISDMLQKDIEHVNNDGEQVTSPIFVRE